MPVRRRRGRSSLWKLSDRGGVAGCRRIGQESSTISLHVALACTDRYWWKKTERTRVRSRCEGFYIYIGAVSHAKKWKLIHSKKLACREKVWSMFCNVKLFIIVLLLLMSKSLIKMLLWYRINKWSLLLMTCLDKPCCSLRDVGVNAWYNTAGSLAASFTFFFTRITNHFKWHSHPSNNSNTSHSVVVVVQYLLLTPSLPRSESSCAIQHTIPSTQYTTNLSSLNRAAGTRFSCWATEKNGCDSTPINYLHLFTIR